MIFQVNKFTIGAFFMRIESFTVSFSLKKCIKAREIKILCIVFCIFYMYLSYAVNGNDLTDTEMNSCGLFSIRFYLNL